MGGSGGSPPERKIEVCKLPESSFSPPFSSLSPDGEEGGDPPLLGLGWMGRWESGVCGK